MTSQRETDMRKDLVSQLCTQSNRVFRIELCIRLYLEKKGFGSTEVRQALDQARLGSLEKLSMLLMLEISEFIPPQAP